MSETNDSTLQMSWLASEKGTPCIHLLYASLDAAMAEFPKLARSAKGFIGKRDFQYAPYREVWACIKDALHKHGITVVQVLHGGPEQCQLTLVVAGQGAEIRSSLCFSREKDVKDFGAQVTYLKRYQLTSFFCLEGDPDADSVDSPAKDEEAKSEPTGTAIELVPAREIKSRPEKTPRSTNDVLNYAAKALSWKVEDFEEFCRARPLLFHGFISAHKMSTEMRDKLAKALVEEGLVP